MSIKKKTRKIFVLVLIFLIGFIQYITPYYSFGQICPAVICLPPCSAFDPEICACLPLGCGLNDCKCPLGMRFDPINQECTSIFGPSILCPDVLQAVCGCNGITYDNICQANVNGVKRVTNGPCSSTSTSSSSSSTTSGNCGIRNCPPPCAAFDPDICSCLPIGCDVRNNSTSSSSSTSSTSSSTTSSSGGNCGITNCPFPCEAFDPQICRCLPFGCDGNMSSTSSSGNSGNDCKCPSGMRFDPINQECTFIFDIGICPLVFAPVCGCDGMTYDNSCQANRSGVKRFTNGSCDNTNKPVCFDNEIRCNPGTPVCNGNNMAICGSLIGLSGELAGPGCTDQERTFFDSGSAVCSNITLLSRAMNQCNKNNLCSKSRKRLKPCREDKASCNCICQFKIKSQHKTPKCSKNNEVTCSKNFTPVCSNPNNKAVCYSGKIVCEDKVIKRIDLKDKVKCRR